MARSSKDGNAAGGSEEGGVALCALKTVVVVALVALRVVQVAVAAHVVSRVSVYCNEVTIATIDAVVS